MQVRFEIEIVCDVSDDPDKHEAIMGILKATARHAYANVALICQQTGGMKPQVAVSSDDFFGGHEEINMLDDVVQTGLDLTQLPDVSVRGYVDEPKQEEPPISNELLEAVINSQEGK